MNTTEEPIEKTKMRQICARVPEEYVKELKIHCVRRGVKVQFQLASIIRDYLESERKPGKVIFPT